MKKVMYKEKKESVEREIDTLKEVYELLQKNLEGFAFLDYYDGEGNLIKRIEIKP